MGCACVGASQRSTETESASFTPRAGAIDIDLEHTYPKSACAVSVLESLAMAGRAGRIPSGAADRSDEDGVRALSLSNIARPRRGGGACDSDDEGASAPPPPSSSRSLQSSELVKAPSSALVHKSNNSHGSHGGGPSIRQAWEQAKVLAGGFNPLDEAVIADLHANVEKSVKKELHEEKLSATKLLPRRAAEKTEDTNHPGTSTIDNEDFMDAVELVPAHDTRDEETGHLLTPLEDVEIFLEPQQESDDMMDIDEDAGSEEFIDEEDDDMPARGPGPSLEGHLDLHALAASLESGKKATTDICSDADVVLVLGGTGVGKSTFIQSVAAGRKITTGFDSSLKRQCYVVDGIGEEGFDIGQGMRSKTRHVRSFYRKASQTFYVDSSGFGDTEGVETDIATSICVKDIASRAKKLRFVVLINAYSFYVHRATELRRNLDLVAKFVGHNFDTFKKSFTFLFTHCNKAFHDVLSEINQGIEEKDQVMKIMRDELYRLLGEVKKGTNDPDLVKLIVFLRASLKHRYPYCDVFDPILSDVVKVARDSEPKTTYALEDPAAHVRCSLTSMSRMSLGQELSKRKQDIASKLQAGRFEESLWDDVRAVCTLARHVDGSDCQEAAEAVLAMLQDALDSVKNEVFEATRKGLLWGEDFHMLSNNEAENAKRGMEKISFVDSLIRECRASLSGDLRDTGRGRTDIQETESYVSMLEVLDKQASLMKDEISRMLPYLDAAKDPNLTLSVKHNEMPDVIAMVTRLRRMQVWAATFKGETESIYREARATATGCIKAVIDDMLRTDKHQTLSAGPRAMRTLALVKQINSSGLLDNLVDAEVRSSGNGEGFSMEKWQQAISSAHHYGMVILTSIEDTVKQAVAVCFDDTSNVSEYTCGGLPASFIRLETVLADIERIHRTIKEERIYGDLREGAEQRHKALVIVVIELLQRCELCERLISNLDANRALVLQFCVDSLMNFATIIPTSMKAEGQVLPRIKQLVHQLGAQLREVAGRVTMMTNQLKSHNCVTGDTETSKASFSILCASQWFDRICEHSDSNVPFVRSIVERTTEASSMYFLATEDEMTTALSRALGGEQDLHFILDNARLLVDLFKNLQRISFVFGTSHARNFLAAFRGQVHTSLKLKGDSLGFPRNVRECNFKGVHNAVVTVEALMSIDEEVDTWISQFISWIESELRKYQTFTDRVINSRGSFEAKGTLLDASSTWSKYTVPLRYLAPWDALQNKIRKDIASHAEALQEYVIESSDVKLKNLDREFEYLLDASNHVDRHIDGEAARWANSIRHLLETKKAELDEQFKGWIDDNNMKEIKSQLTSLKQSDDPMKHNQYRRCVKVLSVKNWKLLERIRSVVKSVRVSPEHNVNIIRENLGTLEQTESSIGRLVGKFPPPSPEGVPWSLAVELQRLRTEMKDTMEASLIDASVAVTELEFLVAVERLGHALLLFQVTKRSRLLRGNGDTRKVSEVQERVSSLFSRVKSSVDEFLQSLETSQSSSASKSGDKANRRKHGKVPFPPDTSFLRNALGQLQSATRMPNCPEEIHRCYGRSKNSLSKGLCDLYEMLELEVKRRKYSRPLKILGFLREEICTRGLDQHVELTFDVATAVGDISDQKAQFQRAIRLDLHDDRKVDALAKRLDELSRYHHSCWYWEEYDENRKSMTEFVQLVVGEAKQMIRNLEFNGLRGRFAVIEHIQLKLGSHLTVKENLGDSVKAALSFRTSTVLDDIKGTIENGNIDHLQVIFAAFHALMIDVPVEVAHHQRLPKHSLVWEFDEICKNLQRGIHDLLFRLTEEALEKFHQHVSTQRYTDAAADAEKLRELGYFLCSAFETYREEICESLVDDTLAKLISTIQLHFAKSEFLKVGRSMGVLRLSSSATVSDVRQAYKKQCLLWHPDKNRHDKHAARQMTKINEANEILEIESNLTLYRDIDFFFLQKAVKNIPGELRGAASAALEDHRYDIAASICNTIEEVTILTSVLRDCAKADSIDVEKIRSSIFNDVRRHGDGVRVDIKKAWVSQDFVELHHSFVALENLENAFKGQREVVPEALTAQVLSDLIEQLERLKGEAAVLRGMDEIEATRAMSDFGLHLIKIGRILDGFPRLKKETTTIIHTILNSCHCEPWGVSFIFKLGLLLENGEITGGEDDVRVGRVVVASFPHFKDVRTVVFNREVITAPAEESIKCTKTLLFRKGQTMENIPVDKNVLKNHHDRYEQRFNQFFTGFVQRGPDKLVTKVFTMVQELGPCDLSNWDDRVKKNVSEIVAGVFAAFTIIKSGDSFLRFGEHNAEGSEVSNAKQLLFTPHNIQVIAILRLLGIGTSSHSLPNHIMEIRTGEGKSIILGALSVVLSLLGFSVRCVCYSEHLSERDNDLFQDVFNAFNVGTRIRYSKISTMSEDSVAREGDIRQLTTDLIRGRPLSNNLTNGSRGAKPTKKRAAKVRNISSTELVRGPEKKTASDEGKGASATSLNAKVSRLDDSPLPLNGQEILLVDEVDVFFGPDFYGKTYNQSAQLVDPDVETLLRRLWERRKEKIAFRNVQSWPEYKAVARTFNDWTTQIEAEVRSMCSDLENFNDPPYEVDPINQRIGYTIMDSVDWELTYGYRTAFAYLNEAERGGLKGQTVDKVVSNALCLRISCGQFSYANISPARILGVSGTLRALSDGEKEIVHEFGVDTYTFVPSVYGKNNLSFDKADRGIVIETERSRYLQTIANEINSATSNGRAAIVFFKDDERLAEFKASSFWRGFRHANVLASTTDKETRNYVIKKAATTGQVTIATAAFGRGTDFFCKDSKLESLGGLMVIQTFLSVEKSEEVQMQGRTARQGKKGSYMLVLLETDICSDFGFGEGEYISIGKDKIYQWLDERRELVHKTKLDETSEKVEKAEERDSDSRKYLSALVRGDRKLAQACLDAVYKGIGGRNLKYCRMVCLSDATGSMSSIWDATRDCIKEMLYRIDELGEGQFELLWVAYRDYSDGSGLLEKSCWTRDPNSLVSFVSSISCHGGAGYLGPERPEAVEIALKEVNMEHEKNPVTRALLIADAPPHFEKRGEILEAHSNHVMSTDYETEANKLRDNDIPVYAFRLNDCSDLVSSFQRISSITGGESHHLDFSSSEAGAKKLIDCVCETALEDIGGSELLAEYKARSWD